MSADPIDDAKEFFRHSNVTGNINDIIESKAPMKLGVDLDNREVFIGVHDKMFFMDLEMAAATLHALFLAIRTLEASINLEDEAMRLLETEIDYSADDIYNGGSDD